MFKKRKHKQIQRNLRSEKLFHCTLRKLNKIKVKTLKTLNSRILKLFFQNSKYPDHITLLK